MEHILPTGSAGMNIGFNNVITGSTYAQRYNGNGGTDGTQLNIAYMTQEWSPTKLDRFLVSYVINIATEEKLRMFWSVWNEATGAGTAPGRSEFVQKSSNTSVAITEWDCTNIAAGSYLADTNLTILGSD